MPKNRKPLKPQAKDELDSLKHEVEIELGLDDDVEERGYENMTTREVGKIGGNMTKKMVAFAEEEMDKRDGHISPQK
ncbi:MAG: alpha/beta-type small acid-soluble spore protein [Bacillota bacterium]|nr:alpha/beta-type small acid-soluble spore protein [Bacillota bacterium]